MASTIEDPNSSVNGAEIKYSPRVSLWWLPGKHLNKVFRVYGKSDEIVTDADFIFPILQSNLIVFSFLISSILLWVPIIISKWMMHLNGISNKKKKKMNATNIAMGMPLYVI